MKKLALFLVLAIFAVIFASQALAPRAYADGEPCPNGTDGECPVSEVCDTGSTPFLCVSGDDSGKAGAGNLPTGSACTNDDQCSTNLACIHNVCQIDPSLEDAGTAGANGKCGQVPGISGSVECAGEQICQIPSGQTEGTCVGNTGNTTSSGGLATGPTTQSGGGSGNGLQSPLKDADITSLLNDILGFAITIGGIAVVLMLVWCGFLFIKAQGNAAQLQEARRMLMWTVIGALVLLGAKAIESGIQATVQSLSS